MQGRGLAFPRPGRENHHGVGLSGLEREIQVRVQHAIRLELRGIIRAVAEWITRERNDSEYGQAQPRLDVGYAAKAGVEILEEHGNPDREHPAKQKREREVQREIRPARQTWRLGRVQDLDSLLRH